MVIELGPQTFKPRISPIQLLLLVQLENSPKYGYEMLKTIREELNGVWVPKTGTIYPALKSLEKHKLIKKYDKDGVDFYKITDEGLDWLLNVPVHQKQNMMFAVKYMTSIIKLSSPNLKKSALTSIIEADGEQINFMNVIIKLLDDDVDKELKITFLKQISKNFNNNLKKVNKIIEEISEDI
jgi:DNA-binding PadR family transcriptional regulator